MRATPAWCRRSPRRAACHGLVTLMITRPNIEWAPADKLTSLTVEGLLHGLVKA